MKQKLKINLPHQLEVWEGTDFSGDSSVAGDERERILIGSEIKPIKIGEYKEQYTGNGIFSEKQWFLIIQKGKPMLIEQVITYHTYGYNIQEEEWTWEAYELPKVKRENLIKE